MDRSHQIDPLEGPCGTGEDRVRDRALIGTDRAKRKDGPSRPLSFELFEGPVFQTLERCLSIFCKVFSDLCQVGRSPKFLILMLIDE